MDQLEFKLSPQLKVGPVCIRLNDLDSMLSFYERDFELEVLRRDGDFIALGAGSANEPVVILHLDEKASKPPHTAAGLYHFALLVPNRRSLAASYVSLGEKGVVFDGYADHIVSEALYLSDPEGNGIEIYSDRPKEKWNYNDEGIRIATQPLDIDSLIRELVNVEKNHLAPIADGTKVGHVHLKVSNLETSLAFYRDVLGFEVMEHLGNAAFLSAGRYHHQIGMNTWESLGGDAASTTAMGLEYFALAIPERGLMQLSERLGVNPVVGGDGSKQLFVSDPDNIKLVFRAS